MLFQSSRSSRYRGGLSIIELLIVISIFTIITAVVLVRHSSFNSTTLLTNLAYDIALSIRQAQAYGISVRSVEGGTFRSAYGVHFDSSVSDSYVLFQDLDLNGIYEVSEFVEQYNLRRGHTIKNACIDTSCFSGGLEDLDITFKRPNPDAIINGNSNANACIVVADADDTSQRIVKVLTTGQISIPTPGTCP